MIVSEYQRGHRKSQGRFSGFAVSQEQIEDRMMLIGQGN